MIYIFPIPAQLPSDIFRTQVEKRLGPQYHIDCQAFPEKHIGVLTCPTTEIRDAIIAQYPVLSLSFKTTLQVAQPASKPTPPLGKKSPPPSSNTYDIYVHPLPDTLSSADFESQIRSALHGQPEIVNAFVMMDKTTSISRGYGFIRCRLRSDRDLILARRTMLLKLSVFLSPAPLEPSAEIPPPPSISPPVTSLDYTSVTFTHSDGIRREGNTIIQTKPALYRSCLIGGVMSTGIHRITFILRHRSSNICRPLLGLMKSLPSYPPDLDLQDTEDGVAMFPSGYVSSTDQSNGSNNDQVKDGDEWSMEVDLRSREKEERTLHWFVRGRQQKGFIKGVPDSVEFGISTYWQDDAIEFVRMEELDFPTVVEGMEGELGIEW